MPVKINLFHLFVFLSTLGAVFSYNVNPRRIPCSRRCLLGQACKAAGVAVIGFSGSVEPGQAIQEDAASAAKKKEEEALRKAKAKQEAENRRIAEETKKRLAAGRIGRI